MIGRHHPISIERRTLAKQFGFRQKTRSRTFSRRFIEQLANCADDSARRLLLGKSEKITQAQEQA